MFDFASEQRRYHAMAKHLHPIGFAHHMRPGSIETLFRAIGFVHIKNARVLEVGCGQGYLVNHFLYAKAKHVIGTEVDPQILSTVPKQAYDVYNPAKQTVEFKVEDFTNTDVSMNVDIITIFIGILPIVQKAINMFLNNRHVKVLAFMVPSRGFAETQEELDALCEEHGWRSTDFSISLSGSGERRKTIVLKKPVTMIDLTRGGKVGA
jgi:SAM-dependent methyltransferase